MGLSGQLVRTREEGDAGWKVPMDTQSGAVHSRPELTASGAVT